MDVRDAGHTFNGSIYQWMTSGGISFEVGFLIDQLTVLMMLVVTFVSLMVHIYTIGYMKKMTATSASSATSPCSPSPC